MSSVLSAVGRRAACVMIIGALATVCAVDARAQQAGAARQAAAPAASIVLKSPALAPMGAGPDRSSLTLDTLYVETAAGKVTLPASLTAPVGTAAVTREAKLADGKVVRLTVTPDGRSYAVKLTAQPATGIVRWGLAIDAAAGEYYTGLMERVVDGPQQASWAPGIKEAMNLRGQRVDMIVKPTTSIYAPFYLSSRGYGVFVKGTWPGHFDFCATTPDRVAIDFEGPSFEMKVYLDGDPATIVRAHAMDAGPPVLPPKWMMTPWRLARRALAARQVLRRHASDRTVQFPGDGGRPDDEGVRHPERRVLGGPPVGARPHGLRRLRDRCEAPAPLP